MGSVFLVVMIMGAAGPSWAQGVPSGGSSGTRPVTSRADLEVFAPQLKALTGRWTDGSCGFKWNDWSISGLDITFHDQSGGVDIERVVGLQPGAFVTEAVVVSHGAPPSLWKYAPVSSDVVRVQNLSSGIKFLLRRCPAPDAMMRAEKQVSDRPTMAVQSLGDAPVAASRIGPSFDCALAREALSGLLCGSDTLSWIDMRFSQAYQALRQQVGEAGQPAARQEAIDFQVQVYAECRLPKVGFVSPSVRVQAEACVGQAYQRQRELWVARLSPTLMGEANRPLPWHLQLQAALQRLGYIPPTSVVDGVYGPATRAAISAWQITSNLPPTGVLSTSEAQRLVQAPNSPAVPVAPLPAIPVPTAMAPLTPPVDQTALRAADEQRLAIAKSEAEKAKSEAEKAQADAERTQAEAQILVARERAEADARRRAAAQAQAEQNAHGLQP